MKRHTKKEIKLPEGTFNVLYADPPWQYEFSWKRGNPETHYSQLSTLEIEAKITGLKIANDAVLFLWATNPKIEDALKVMKAWGFEYKTNMVWVKDRMGTGYYIRGKHELLLIGKRGNFPVPEQANRPPSVFEAPRLEHSVKPPVTYILIEQMYPHGQYIELFARHKRDGWEAWGDQLAA